MLETGQRNSLEVEMNGSVQDGFWIRRRASPLAVTSQRRVQRAPTSMDNKENVIPSWAVTVRRPSSSRRKSPLPAWYPRTPLRDITFILQAIERRNKKASAAGTQQRRDGHESSSTIHVLESPLPQEPTFLDHTLSHEEALASDITETTPGVKFTSNSSLSTTEDPLEPSSKCLIPPERPSHLASNKSMDRTSEQPTNPELTSTELISGNQQTIEYEKKLGSSIDEIEKVVLRKLKPTPNMPKKTTRVLMSMR